MWFSNQFIFSLSCDSPASLSSLYHVILLSIYLVLFVLQVAHKASTRARQQCRSAETRSRRPHVQPFSFISLSTVLLQVSLGRLLFLWPSGVHRRAILVKAVVCWRSTCPIHHQRLRFTFSSLLILAETLWDLRWKGTYWGFLTGVVYLVYIPLLRYTILVGNLRCILWILLTSWWHVSYKY